MIRDSTTIVITTVCLTILPATPVSADFFDKLKEVTGKARDVVKDAKDSVVGSREVVRQVEDLKQTVIYADSYTPSRQEASRLQSSLGQLGFSVGNPDGLIGERTRDGIRLYQSAYGLPADGIMSYDLIQSIVSTAQRSSPVQATLSRGEWQQYQELLNRLGYDVGTPDGLPGKRTQAAVERFLIDRQLPVVNNIDRYGFVAAQRAANGDGVVSWNAGGTLAGSVTTGGLATGHANGNPLSLAAQASGIVQAEDVLTIGSNVIGAESDIAAQRALSLLLLESQPELLDNLERVDTWFKLEGRTVESEYLRPAALNEFRESLRQQRVSKPVVVRALQRVSMRRGGYDPKAGVFKVNVGGFSEYVGLPHLNISSFDLAVRGQLPTQQPADEYASFAGESILGIPMSLEQAIELERTQMVNSRGGEESHLFLIAMAEVTVNALSMPPLARGETNGLGSFRKVTADATLRRLSLHTSKRGRGDGTLGELFHEWSITPVANSPTSAFEVSAQTLAVSADVQSVADRFQMSIVDGHLDTTTGELNQFAAALAMGHDPGLLDRAPEGLYLAEALLSPGERRELFGNVRSVSELDDMAAESAHQGIKGELRNLFLSRAVSPALPLLLVHDANLGQYDAQTQRFPLQAGGHTVAYSGKHAIVSGSRGPALTANTGNRWVPEEVAPSSDVAATLNGLLFGNSTGRPNASVRHGRFGAVSDLKVGMTSSGGSSPALAVAITVDVKRDVLLAKKFDEVLYEFPATDPHQENFDALLDVLAKPVATQAALIESVITFPDVDRFRNDFVLSSNRVRAANEFDRGEQIQLVTSHLEQQAARQNGPLWLQGTVTLGKYQFETQSFTVSSLSLSPANGNMASNQIQFRAKIDNKSYGDLRVSIPREKAEELVKAFSDRTFQIRARVTPLGAVAELQDDRPESSHLMITHRVDELALVLMEHATSRQSWELLSRDQFGVESMPVVSTEEQAMQPVAIQLEEEPFLDSDILLLMAAQSGQEFDESAWNWLQQSRHAYDTTGAGRLGTAFFEQGGAAWDRSVGQINAPRFKSWVAALELPDLENVRVLLSTDHTSARPSVEQCHWARSELQWENHMDPTFQTMAGKGNYPLSNAEIAQLRRDEFVVESQVHVGFATLSGTDCGNLRSRNNQATGLPKVTLVFDRLPVLGGRASKAAIASAKVNRIEFAENGQGLPNVTVALTLNQIDFHDGSNTDQSQILRSFGKDDLIEPEPVGKDPRLAVADVVGVKLGMSLEEAASVLDAHFGSAHRVSLRRGFTTNPKRFENSDLWLSQESGEYIVVFFEGEPETSTVLGITRGLHLEGNDFDRAAALEVLRSKYGPEDHVTADASLNLLWGKYVTDWPELFGRRQTESRMGMGACQVELQQNRTPADLRDDSGAVVDVRELLNGSSRAGGFHVRWPQLDSGRGDVSSACDFYLEAFHDDRSGASVFLGMFDIAAYEDAYQSMKDSGVIDPVEDNDLDARKPLVKF